MYCSDPRDLENRIQTVRTAFEQRLHAAENEILQLECEYDALEENTSLLAHRLEQAEGLLQQAVDRLEDMGDHSDMVSDIMAYLNGEE